MGLRERRGDDDWPAARQIGKGYFSKAKSFPVLKQRREGKRRSDFEKGSPRPLHPSYVLQRHS